MCVATVRRRIKVCVDRGVKGSEGVDVCVWVGFFEGRGFARLWDVVMSERPTNETLPVYLHIYCG